MPVPFDFGDVDGRSSIDASCLQGKVMTRTKSTVHQPQTVDGRSSVDNTCLLGERSRTVFFHLLRWACHVDGRLLVGARRKPIALAGVGFHHRREPDTPEYIQVNGWLLGCSRQVAPWQRMARSPLGKNNQACRGWVEWWVASFRLRCDPFRPS